MPHINPDFADEIKKYGADDFNLCFNCGNCTAVCSLSTNDESFPREMIRYSTLGLEDEIKSSLKPWLCYYCGECSTDCPRQANPGELMMSLRRWLTAQYDWTGLSGLLYKHIGAYIGGMLVLLAGVIGFTNFSGFDREQVIHYGHLFEMLSIAGVFAAILLPNIIHMWYLTIVKPKVKPSLKVYAQSTGDLFVHMFTQKRFLGCEDTRENRTRWILHFILVLSYLSLLFTTVFLNWFSTTSKFVIWLGYFESAAIFIITTVFMSMRFRKVDTMHKHSQPSDWFFVIWLFLMGITSFAVRLLIDLNNLDSQFWMYTLHLTVLAQWALIIVPFGKWTHFLYRSFAMYFQKILELNRAVKRP
ncbi:MAG: 4Fe-4S dicluster domain-containing protein [Bacteroidales bacterium]|nr:4Fe-4S dicluster domain-containing protein [Bacteroidales bacterium]HPH00975.1 4Fe-4S dicluster domain-containing protein [Tenuifilaceae bacterium]